jgi:cystathionine beta-synthase
MDMSIVDEWVTVSDRDSFEIARRITREEGILVGGSTGTAMWAAMEVAQRMDEGQVILTIFPDTGRGYLSKLYNDAWMRDNGFLDRLPIHARVRDLVAKPERELPTLVTVPANKTVREAIDLLQQYNISQLPVTRGGAGDGNGYGPFTDVHLMIGSIQERNLLERVFRDPQLVEASVEAVMDPPFPLVDVAEEVERIVPALLANNSAVLVEEAGQPVGLITRSDLLEFVAHGQGR